MKTAVGVLLLFAAITAHAQNRLSGRVINAITKAPVPFANVFFANTTIGMSAREDGSFTLEGFPSGKYDLTVTSIGFRQFQQPVDFSTPHQLAVEILMQENILELNEIVVKEDTSQRIFNYRMFKRLFIGENSYAKKCSILNPEDIHLYFDPDLRQLTAHSRKPIEIVNKALGIKIIYHLNSFQFDYKSEIFMVTGIPQIQYLRPKSKSEERRWINERKDAYYGSLIHFMRMLIKDSLTEAGFAARKIYSIPNKKRIPQQLIDAGIKKFGSAVNTSGMTTGRNDSLAYFMRMKNEPELTDSIGREIITGKQFVRNGTSVEYTGKLQVIFKKEKEEWEYVKSNGRSTRNNQTSILHFIGKRPLRIYPNGYYENQTDIFLEGYWSWSEKTSCLLPLDYQPGSDTTQFIKP